MIDDEPESAQYYDERNIWTVDPTSADKEVYGVFAADVVRLVQLLDENEPLMSRDVYARFFASLLASSRMMGEYEDSWNEGYQAP
ncbi:hypothetical protein [Ruegeria sp.]|uniref:hypothetical protein n=1 Tax=Ruegeria sp. TaxID=1879320 RepID=UPI003B5A1C55